MSSNRNNTTSKPAHTGDDEIPSQVIKEMHVTQQLHAELQEVATRVHSVRMLQQLQQEHIHDEDMDASVDPRAKSAVSLTMSPGGHRTPSLAGLRPPSSGFLTHGSSPNASAGSKVWNDFRSFWGASSTLYEGETTRLSDNWLQKILHNMKGIGRVVQKRPWVVIIPLIVLAASVGVGVWAVLAASNQQTATYKSDCDKAVQSTIQSIQSAISQALAPSTLLRDFVSEYPEWPTLNRKFPSLAKKLLSYEGAKDTQSLELLPFGVYAAIFPLNFADLSLGQDLFYAEPGDFVGNSRKAGMLGMLYQPDLILLQGPISSYVGPNNNSLRITSIRAISSVFVSGVAQNETFQSPTNGTTGCPSFPCYNPYTRSKYWGSISSVVSFEGLKKTYQWERLDYEMGYDYYMYRVDLYTKVKFDLLFSRYPPRDPLVYNIPVSNGNWTLLVSRHDGWDAPWTKGLVAAVVILCVILSSLLFFLIVKQSQHSDLLMSMVPKKVLRYLEAGRTYAEAFDNVSIIFSDIVSYTKMSSSMSAEEVATLLNEIYSLYDELCVQHGMRRVDIIGDSYMCVAGCPEPEDRVQAAVKAVRMAQAMITITHAYITSSGLRIKIRVGINSGPVVATVIGGNLNPKFTLLGDSVNTASRMESNSEPMRIHISEDTANLITLAGLDLHLVDRGETEIKGKGLMHTYFVEGANHLEKAKSFSEKAKKKVRHAEQDPEMGDEPVDVGK